MGAEESAPIRPQPPPRGLDYFALSLRNYQGCKINAIFGNENDLSMVRDAISRNWGLTMEKLKYGQYFWTFTLRGYPFTKGTSSHEAAGSRRMICQILQNLNNAGLELQIVSDLTRLNGLSTFFFNRSHRPRPIQYPLLCIGLSSYDKLQLVNAPDSMVSVIKNVVANSWRGGIRSEGPTGNSYEIKLIGSPWHAEANQGIQARLLLAKIISALAQKHWVFHAAANLKSTSDTLFFKYDSEAVGPQLVNHHFVISLNRSDRLRLIDAPQALIPVVRQVIISVWTAMGGIQKEQDYYGSWEFKLSGNPWQSYGNYDAVMGRFLICKILEALRGQGWDVKTSIDVSRSQKDKNILVMTPLPCPVTTPVMCLSFTGKDKIRVINASEDLVGVCREILMSRWTRGIARDERMRTSFSTFEFKLNGCPWHGTYSSESLCIQSILCYIIQAFAARGWKYITSADVSAKYEKEGENGPTYPVDVHSWWFAHEPQAAAQPTVSDFMPLSTAALEPTAPTFMPLPPGAQSTEPEFMPPPPSYEEVMRESKFDVN